MTINKFMVFKKMDLAEFSRTWKNLRVNQLTLEDRKVNRALFGSINDIKQIFDHVLVRKNDITRGRTKLAVTCELPDKFTYLMEFIFYDNLTKFDIKMASDSPNQEYIVSTLQTLAFLLTE